MIFYIGSKFLDLNPWMDFQTSKSKSLKILRGIHRNCQIINPKLDQSFCQKKRSRHGSGSKTLTKTVKKVFIEALWHTKAFNMASFLTKLVQGGGFTSKSNISVSNFLGADLIANKSNKKEGCFTSKIVAKVFIEVVSS